MINCITLFSHIFPISSSLITHAQPCSPLISPSALRKAWADCNAVACSLSPGHLIRETLCWRRCLQFKLVEVCWCCSEKKHFFFCGSKQHVLLHCKNNRQWHEPSRPWPLRSDDWIIETLWTTWSHVTWKPFGNHFIISSFQFMSIHFKWLQWFPFSFPTQSSFSWSLSTLPPCHLRVPGPGGDLLGRTGSAHSPCLEGSPGTGGTHRNGQGTLQSGNPAISAFEMCQFLHQNNPK